MFEKGTYVFHETGGVCLLADVCYAPLEGMPSDRQYYVLKPVHDESSVIYVPVDSDRIFLRQLLKFGEATELFTLIPTVEIIDESNAKQLRTKYIECMKKYDPIEWVRVIKTVRARAIAQAGRSGRLSDTERSYAEIAAHHLCTELALVLGQEKRRVNEDIEKMIANE